MRSLRNSTDLLMCLMHHEIVFQLSYYSQSPPGDQSRKRPALVTTTIVKPRLNCHLNSVIKSSRKRPRPLLGITNWSFPLFLSSRNRPLKDSDMYYGNSLIKVYTL